jgi:hypothetical protein
VSVSECVRVCACACAPACVCVCVCVQLSARLHVGSTLAFTQLHSCNRFNRFFAGLRLPITKAALEDTIPSWFTAQPAVDPST